MPAPTSDDLDIQDAWDNAPLRAHWPWGPDNAYYIRRLEVVPVEATGQGAAGRLLEVAAAEAVHACRLAEGGLEAHVLEPSAVMLGKARARMDEFAVHLHLVRGIAEALPYGDRAFDRVLIDAAIDHLSAPDRGVREMVRVLKSDGRFVVSYVNYASVSVRLSRALYRLIRRLAPRRREEHFFWDTPVPEEHTFECTYRNIGELCGQYLELERVVGVSLLWGTPGWSYVLAGIGSWPAKTLLAGLDALARRVPVLADYVLMVWRPRRPGEAPGSGLRALPALQRLGGAAPGPPPPRLETMRVTPADPVYQRLAAEDERWEAGWWLRDVIAARLQAAQPWANRALTGDPHCSPLDLLAARGPFARAVLLGGDDETEAEAWLRATATGTLDVVDHSAARLARLRTRLAPFADRVRFLRQDPNFLRLEPGAYDAAVVAGGIGRVVNLEYVFDELALALRPGGQAVLTCYVGERRHAFAPARLALVNAALARVPLRFRFDDPRPITPSAPDEIAAFRAVRSDEIVAAASARFEVVETRFGGRLFPLFLHLDVPALEREAPALLEEILAHEQALAADPAATPCAACLLLRRR
ncbi:MAG: class I SAM-dependent methyltransferase [Candidatus Binatia bacterium]